MTLADFDISRELVVSNSMGFDQVQNTQKLPFDINDYLNFELNEDFISATAVFMNGYCDETKFSSGIETADGGNETDADIETNADIDEYAVSNDDSYEFYQRESMALKYEPSEMEISDSFSDDDLFSFMSGYSHSNDDSFPSVDTPSYSYGRSSSSLLSIEEESNALFKQKQRKSCVIEADSGYNFMNLDIHHEDFQCSVMNKDRSLCRDSVLCTLHSYREKYNVSRSEDLEKLIRNYKYLKYLNKKLIDQIDTTAGYPHSDSIAPDIVSTKRRNSYQDNLVRPDSSGNLCHDVEFDMIGRVISNKLSPYDFIQSLTLKLLAVNQDPETRLMEFHYRNDLKNFAVSQLYNDNDFQMG